MFRPSPGYLALALVLAAGAVAFLLYLWLQPSPAPAAGEDSAKALAPASNPAGSAAPTPAQKVAPLVTQAAPASVPDGVDPTRDLSSYVMRGEKPTMPEVIDRLHKAGIHGGLGAFSPPGTRPPIIGLAVPEDFVLPEGYVRHHQVTDDGQRIEAILMFAPDRPFFDAAGKPIPVPANRVVPPEYAPPGLPIRRIVLPKPIEPENSGR